MVTIKDVAKYANVSIGTVSKYINGIKIRKDNEERIAEAIQVLHYRVNATARAIKTARTSLIALIMDDLAGAYFPQIVKRIEHLLYEKGYNVFVLDSDDSTELEREKIEFILEKNVDGFIVCPLSGGIGNYQYILSLGKPLCVMDQYLPDLACSQIVSDNVGAAYQATMRLLNGGHRRIGIITGESANLTASERLQGYRLAYETFGLSAPKELVCQTGFDEDHGVLGMEALMTLDAPPTACIACNYHTLQGAFLYTRVHNIRIPEDITLLGFDHTLLPVLSGLPIPIIRQNIDQIASVTVHCLLEQMKNGATQTNSIHRIAADCSDLDQLPAYFGVKSEPAK